MLEAATGLPIGHRAFRCAHASGNIVSGMMLEDLAVDFGNQQHCRGCAFRVRSGLLGDTIATLAAARRADQEARAGREKAEAAERQRQRDERAARRSRRGAGEQYQSVTQLQYVDKLDAGRRLAGGLLMWSGRSVPQRRGRPGGYLRRRSG